MFKFIFRNKSKRSAKCAGSWVGKKRFSIGLGSWINSHRKSLEECPSFLFSFHRIRTPIVFSERQGPAPPLFWGTEFYLIIPQLISLSIWILNRHLFTDILFCKLLPAPLVCHHMWQAVYKSNYPVVSAHLRLLTCWSETCNETVSLKVFFSLSSVFFPFFFVFIPQKNIFWYFLIRSSSQN